MKNIYYSIFAFFLLITGSTFSQSFAPLGAEWHYNKGNGQVPPNSEYYHYKVIKDTVYNAENARKIEIEHFRYAGDSVQLDPLFVFDRNDSVFYYNNHHQRYLLLYDFTASAGDTLFFTIPDTNHIANNNSLFRIIVDSLSFVTINGKSLKKIHTSPLDLYSFYNGYTKFIGSEFLMLPQPIVSILVTDGPLRCYQDSAIFIQFSTQNCEHRLTITSVEENSFVNDNIKIHPNPVNQYASIKMDGIKIARMELMNVHGQMIKVFPPQSTILSFKDIEDGIYLIHITTEDHKQFSKKMIVHH